ncbi:MAG: hypothetical protein O3B41_01730 [Bacteroidetes bacterium]|nr:hypothetical protein [Bacteroidota bacterium]
MLSFVGVTLLLLFMTLLHRFRIRGVRMAWQVGSWHSFPVWPTLFMGLIIVFLVYAQNTFPPEHLTVFAGYFVGGMAWFVAVAMSASVVVTEYGIIPEAGRSSEAVGWGQVSDYFEVEDGKRVHFAFMYQDYLGERKRLDLYVPSQEVNRFRGLVRSKLDVPLDLPPQRIMIREALEKR